MLASDYGHKYSVDSDGDLEIDITAVSYIYLTEKDLLDMLSAVRSYDDKFKGE